MEEIRIGFGRREKRKTLLRLAALVALFGVVGIIKDTPSQAGSPWTIPVVLAMLLILAATTLLNHTWGTTLLTPTGIVMQTLLRRRTVPWDQITRIEVKRRSGLLGNPRMVARIHRTNGAAIELPGLQQSGTGQSKPDFQERVGVLLRYWQQATGRTEAVLVTP
ncbi:PH domain-containing protein [Streptacidiphilus sp. MAP12-16]|uniref:PH domain-containing protein n=1 Tax=Streptacidiphilus sp. MAP12-16 TaxID=3156300 RepID=UPI0035167DAF